ncbi:MAG: cytochrome d ubiquinol oxidase subunit II [Halodesulfurarchaeum sp.]
MSEIGHLGGTGFAPLSLADGPLWNLPLVDLWYVVIFLTLAMFLWLDGTNLGIGVLFGLVSDEEVRKSMLAAVAPLWDGAEVWLIVFGGALFAVFPDVYAGLFSGYYLLMFAILAALIVRGIAPEFREQRHDERWQRLWGRLFVLGSVLAPFLLGIFAGNWLVGATASVSLPGLVVGLALVALTSAEGAAFIGMKLPEGLSPELERYGTVAQGAYLVLAVVAVGYLYLFVEGMAAAIVSAGPIAIVGLTAALGVGYTGLLRRGQNLSAFIVSAVQTFGLVALVGLLRYPVIYPPEGLTVAAAAVSPLQLNVMTIVLAIFLPLVLLYFAVLYSAFSGPIQPGEGY